MNSETSLPGTMMSTKEQMIEKYNYSWPKNRTIYRRE